MVTKINKFSFKDFLSHNKMDNRIHGGLAILKSFKIEIDTYLLQQPVRFDYLGVCLIRKGTLKLSLNFIEHTLSQDTIYFLSPMVVMQILDCSEDIEMHTMFTDFDFFQKMTLPVYKAYSMEKLGREYETILLLDSRESSRFYEYFNNLEHQNTAREDLMFRMEIIKMTLMLLFYEISAKISGNLDKTHTGFEHKNRTVMEFLNLVSFNFKATRSVQYYADQLFISRKHLSRIVKEVTGKTPKAIIEEIVISEAVILLNVSSMSIKDVMGELNFSDFGTFSKFFKNMVGKSPLLYRKQLDKNEF
jgi:AraC family transcriptional activator of pobA